MEWKWQLELIMEIMIIENAKTIHSCLQNDHPHQTLLAFGTKDFAFHYMYTEMNLNA